MRACGNCGKWMDNGDKHECPFSVRAKVALAECWDGSQTLAEVVLITHRILIETIERLGTKLDD